MISYSNILICVGFILDFYEFEMWGFFSKDPIANFGYEIGECVDNSRSQYSLWSFHTAKKRGSSEEFSAFVANATPGQDYQVCFDFGSCCRKWLLFFIAIVCCSKRWL